MLCAPSGPISGSRGQRKACQCSAGTCCLPESVLGSTRARTFIFRSTSPSRPYTAVCSVERFSSLSAPGSAKHGPVCYRVSFRTGSACACVWGAGGPPWVLEGAGQLLGKSGGPSQPWYCRCPSRAPSLAENHCFGSRRVSCPPGKASTDFSLSLCHCVPWK